MGTAYPQYIRGEPARGARLGERTHQSTGKYYVKIKNREFFTTMSTKDASICFTSINQDIHISVHLLINGANIWFIHEIALLSLSGHLPPTHQSTPGALLPIHPGG